MPQFSADEILQTHERYLGVRKRIEQSEIGWDALAEFFTDDASFVDPAWGRIDGLANIKTFLVESMAGLEDWSFPHEWLVVEGERLVAGWQNRLPGQRADGTPYEATGVSILAYAGDGLFSYEEDVLNIVHVTELIRESGWKPGPGFQPPPARPRR